MRHATAFLAVILTALPLLAQEKAASLPNPLADLPSSLNAEHIAKIKALGDNDWGNLGQDRARGTNIAGGTTIGGRSLAKSA